MNIRRLLRGRLAAALEGLVPIAEQAPFVEMVVPGADPKFGDYQVNCAMPLGKLLKKPPRDVAQELVGRLRVDDVCAPPEIAGPGFINLRLRDEYAAWDARRRFTIDLAALWDHAPSALVSQCQCGDIMAGIASPHDCRLFGRQCTPDNPVGACMVSAEGTCRIWHQYDGQPDLRTLRRAR